LRGFGLRTRRRTRPIRRDHVRRVEECVDEIGEEPAEEGRVVDPVHDDEKLVEGQLAHPAHHPGHHALIHDCGQAGEAGGSGPSLALGEEPLTPGAGLEDHVLARVQSPVRAVEEEVLEAVPGVHARNGAPAECRAAHPDGIDLVDEDDALAAPLPRQLLRLASEPADDDRVHAHERLLEARPGHAYEWTIEACRDRLRQHRLARSGRTEEEQAALTLAPRLF